jgi:hypothetical protein
MDDIYSYEVIFNNDNIIVSLDESFDFKLFKLAYFGDFFCIQKMDGKVIKFQKMEDSLVKRIKRQKKLLLAKFSLKEF